MDNAEKTAQRVNTGQATAIRCAKEHRALVIAFGFLAILGGFIVDFRGDIMDELI